jgi:hypothetical protein
MTQAYSFPIARRVWQLAQRGRANWLLRHQDRRSFAIHLVGIPLALLVAPLLLILGEWQWAISAFGGGYFLQWIGHRMEGNHVGELIPVRRLLGLPVVAIAPQFQVPNPPPAN